MAHIHHLDLFCLQIHLLSVLDPCCLQNNYFQFGALRFRSEINLLKVSNKVREDPTSRHHYTLNWILFLWVIWMWHRGQSDLVAAHLSHITIWLHGNVAIVRLLSWQVKHLEAVCLYITWKHKNKNEHNILRCSTSSLAYIAQGPVVRNYKGIYCLHKHCHFLPTKC